MGGHPLGDTARPPDSPQTWGHQPRALNGLTPTRPSSWSGLEPQASCQASVADNGAATCQEQEHCSSCLFLWEHLASKTTTPTAPTLPSPLSISQA